MRTKYLRSLLQMQPILSNNSNKVNKSTYTNPPMLKQQIQCSLALSLLKQKEPCWLLVQDYWLLCLLFQKLCTWNKQQKIKLGIFILTLQLQDMIVNSPFQLLHISLKIGYKNLVFDQSNILYLMSLSILTTCLLNDVWIS